MEVKKKARLNPELESLRLKALNSALDVERDLEINEVIRRTSRIHASFLFYSPKTLQALTRAIAETNIAALDKGWQSFGDKLGLDVSILKVIRNNEFNHQDPVYNTLLHYTQYEDATIGKILTALKEMGRFDVIARTKDVILQLTEAIFSREQDLLRPALLAGTSDYGSLSSNEYSGELSPIDNPVQEAIIRPQGAPNTPFILKNIEGDPILSTLLLRDETTSRMICSESYSYAMTSLPPVQAVSDTRVALQETTQPARKKFVKKVLLTFVEDGATAAQEVAEIFRQERKEMGRIGVLILKEQTKFLNADPLQFISAAFYQVDYVVPIVTEGYLKSLLRKVRSTQGTSECVDANYVPYIYKLMTDNYVRNTCLNDKVRCVVPDDSIDKVCKQLMFACPLFSAWERLSSTDLLAERLLRSIG